MAVRLVLTLAFALALVAAAQPAVDHATRTRDAASLDASADRVADAVAALDRRSEPGRSLASAPRRTLRLDVPDGAAIALADRPPRVVARPPNGTPHATTLPVRVAVCGDRSDLDGRVTLAYVDRADGPVVVALRGFIRGDATTAAHACTPGPPRDRRARLRL
ncbi:DUF7311 family protein [Halobacterium yunchengense]|uniref:DUF7311 family protein n=1 Tax=Halobacterium yunchengense TaxID=3108497 RepID=UPI003008B0C6